MMRRVEISENGRSGGVRYRDGHHSIEGDWEFGGGDVVAIVGMGSRADWARVHPGALARRAEILRFVADEVIRQRAPACSAEIDDERGEILLREAPAGGPRIARASGGPEPSSSSATDRATSAASFVHRWQEVRSIFSLGVLAAFLVVGSLFWAGRSLFLVEPANGVPLGPCVRTETHIASLIQSTDPHLPRWSGRGGGDTTSIRILLIPLDGSPPQLVPVVDSLPSSNQLLTRIFGSDGRTLWFDVTGLQGVSLRDHTLVTTEDLQEANPDLDSRWWEDPRRMDVVDGRLHILSDDHRAAIDVDPRTWQATPATPKPKGDHFETPSIERHLAAGFFASDGVWLGLHSPSELEADFSPGSFVRPIESTADGKALRRLFRGELEPGYDPGNRRIRAIAPLQDDELLEAAFLRADRESEPPRLADPDGALMIHTSAPGLAGTLVVSRIDLEGRPIWRVDTGLDRFLLQQILPGDGAWAFVGTAPPVPNVLSEPFVVLVDVGTGAPTRHSLWR